MLSSLHASLLVGMCERRVLVSMLYFLGRGKESVHLYLL